ncbi:MAG: dephospho-CoA kinase [Gammaproteobacteria bacterium]|nr:MAG: dephospho-CoA kinase [Gammaproteobacteria bacterium]
MLVIGLTGGIGSGKTTVSGLFMAKGISVIDADEIARTITSSNADIITQIIAVFGVAVLNPEGTLDRKQLRKIVFADDAKRSELESITHPVVQEEILRQVSCCQSSYCVVSIPLLFETGMQDLVDRVLVVDTSPELQIERSMRRDEADESVIRAIMATQIDRPSRLSRAADTIQNESSLERLDGQVESLHQMYLKLAENQH